jgi:hypothetical protein
MVRMIKKVNGLNAFNIPTYFNEPNELNDHNVSNALIEYLHVIFSRRLFFGSRDFLLLTIICVDFTLINFFDLLLFMGFSATQPADKDRN